MAVKRNILANYLGAGWTKLRKCGVDHPDTAVLTQHEVRKVGVYLKVSNIDTWTSHLIIKLKAFKDLKAPLKMNVRQVHDFFTI